LEDFLEDVFESPVVSLQYGILSGQVKRILATNGILEAAVSEADNGLVCVVHSHGDARTLEVVDLNALRLAAVGGLDFERESRWYLYHDICSFVLYKNANNYVFT